jgi:tRNA(Ile)-lysidine synthase
LHHRVAPHHCLPMLASPDIGPPVPGSSAGIDNSIDVGIDSIDEAARALLVGTQATGAQLVLAVSGGCDSMVLMHAVARALASGEYPNAVEPVTVATFDHGTGVHATRAAALVVSEATRLGLAVRVGRESLAGATEAQWRSARWRFFRDVCGPHGAVATAHTRDDQVETVVMRVLRGSGARGIAALAAPAPGIERPLVRIAREAVRRYAVERAVSFIEDPSNASRTHLRNRVRHDLLPAIRKARPRFEDEMRSLADRAALWRGEVDDIAASVVSEGPEHGAIRVARGTLATYDSAVLCVLWPAIAARALVTLDRRGTLRLAQFTSSGASGSRIQLSGGVEVIRHRDFFVLHRTARTPVVATECPLAGVVEFGAWRFQPVAVSNARAVGEPLRSGTLRQSSETDGDDPWTCDLPGDRPLSIREWRPADRMRGREDGSARRVKRFFGDAHIPGPSRTGWPVVLVDNEIVWIPGVRRTVAAPVRSGRPVVRYACERFVSRHAGS